MAPLVSPITDLQDPELERIDMLAAAEDAGQPLPGGAPEPVDVFLGQQGFYDPEGKAEEEIAPDRAETQLGDYLEQLRRNALDQRWGHDENLLMNTAFLDGHQYVETDRSRRAVVEIPAPRDAIRRTINRIAPWYRSQHGKLSGGMPDYFIRPKRKEQRVRDATRFANELAEWLVEKAYSHLNRGAAAMWKLLGGVVALKVTVEWELADDLVHPDGGEVYRPVLQFRVYGGHQVWADLRCAPEDLQWVGFDDVYRVADARAEWPEFYEHIFPNGGVPTHRAETMRNRLAGFQNPADPFNDVTSVVSPAGPNAAGLEGEEDVTICEFWGKKGLRLQFAFADQLDPARVPFRVVAQAENAAGEPVVEFPRGLRVVFTTEGTVLEYGPNHQDDLPVEFSRFSAGPGLFAPSPMNPLRELQKCINWLQNLREMGIEKLANPVLLQPAEARVSRRGLIHNVTKVLKYRANRFGAEPKYMQAQQPSADLVQFEARMDAVWMDIAALHEVSQAKLPSANVSGVAISLLQEQDLAQLGYSGSEEEQAFLRVLKKAMVLVQKFFPANDPRMLQLAGDAEYTLKAFMAADLTTGLDIQVVKGSSLPRSPAAVRASAIDAWKLGVLTDRYGRPDKRRMQDLMGFGSSDDLFAEEELDIQNARDEEDLILGLDMPIAMMVLVEIGKTGQLPPWLMPKPEDDQLVHEYTHRMRLKQLQHERSASDVHVMLLRAHWALTVRVVAPLLAQMDPETLLSSQLPAQAGLLGGQGQVTPGAGQEAGAGDEEQGGQQPAATAA